MKYVLVLFNDNWADEMDISGFDILTESNWENIKASMSKLKFPFTIYCGTNEEIEYPDEKDLMSCFTVNSLEADQAEFLLKIFPRGSFGFTPIEAIWECWED